MKIILNDLIQKSDAPEFLKSPALTQRWEDTSLTIILESSQTFNAVGIGGTDATSINVNGEVITFIENGLYIIPELTTDTINLSHNGTYMGRFAVGVGHDIGLSPSREPGFYSTSNPRTTQSGQVIAGAGGYSGQLINVEAKYKITETIYNDIKLAYPDQISKGFPFFFFFDCQVGYPLTRLYGAFTDKKFIFQSSVRSFLYSKKLKIKEAF